MSFPCVWGPVLRCASRCSVPVWSVLLSVPHLSFGGLVLLPCSATSGLGLPVLRGFFFSFFVLPLPSHAPAVSGFLCFPAWGALGLGALRLLLPPPAPPNPPAPPPFFFPFVVLRFLPSCALHPCCHRLWRCPVPGPGCPRPWRCAVSPPPLPPRPFFSFLSCPPPSPLWDFPPPRPLVWAFLLFPALGALGLGALCAACAARPLSLSVFVFFLAFPLLPCSCRSWCSWLLHLLAGFLFPPLCVALHLVCALCAGAVPPSPPFRRLLVSCCVLSLVVWCRGLLWAGLCGLCCFAVFFGAVWCWCRAVWCVVVLCCWSCRWRSPVGVASLFFVDVVRRPVVTCCFVRCFVVCGAFAPCCVVCCAVCCPGGRCHLVVGPAALSGVFLPCPTPPPCCCPLLLLPGLLSWPAVVFCPGLRCCVVLLCRPSCGVLMSASLLAGGALLLRSL